MAYPPEYVRQFSFLEWQALHPGEPLPGTEVDSELDDVSVALTATQANLALIQRADGKLANASVDADQLVPGLFDHVADSIIAAAEAHADAAEASATLANSYKVAADLAAQAALAYQQAAAADAATVTNTAAEALASTQVASAAEIVAQNASIAAANSASSAQQSETDAEHWSDVAFKWAEYLAGPVEPAPPGWPEAVDDGMFSAKWWAVRAQQIVDSGGPPLAPLSVFANPTNAAAVGQSVAAGGNDTFLRRVGDTIDFGKLTTGMFTPGVIPVAALPANVALLPVSYNQIQQAAPLSVLGRAVNSAGVLADIPAGADGDVLQRKAGVLVFAPTPAAGGLAPIPAYSALANPTNVAAVPTGVEALANDTILSRVGNALVFGKLTTGMFPAGVVPAAALPANVMLEGENVSLLANDAGYIGSAALADYARLSQANTFTANVQRIQAASARWVATDGGMSAALWASGADGGAYVGTLTNHPIRIMFNGGMAAEFAGTGLGNITLGGVAATDFGRRSQINNWTASNTFHNAFNVAGGAGPPNPPLNAPVVFLDINGPQGRVGCYNFVAGAFQPIMLKGSTVELSADAGLPGITIGGVPASDFARLSQSNLFAATQVIQIADGNYALRVRGDTCSFQFVMQPGAAEIWARDAVNATWKPANFAADTFNFSPQTGGLGGIVLAGVAASDFARKSQANSFSGTQTVNVGDGAAAAFLVSPNGQLRLYGFQSGTPTIEAANAAGSGYAPLAIRSDTTTIYGSTFVPGDFIQGDGGGGMTLRGPVHEKLSLRADANAASANAYLSFRQLDTGRLGYLGLVGGALYFYGENAPINLQTSAPHPINLTSANAINLNSALGLNGMTFNGVGLGDFARLSQANTFANQQTIDAGASAAALNLKTNGGAHINFYKGAAAFGAFGSTENLGGVAGGLGFYLNGALRFQIDPAGGLTTNNAHANEVGFKGTPPKYAGGVNYILELEDCGRVVKAIGGTTQVTIPQDATRFFPDGTVIRIHCRNGGALTITHEIGGLYANGTGTGGAYTLPNNSVAEVYKSQGNEWIISGPIA